MSRIGKKIIDLTDDIKVKFNNNVINIAGPKGDLDFEFNTEMKVTYSQDDKTILVERPSDSKAHKTIHGTTRALIANMVEGVTKGFQKELKIIGVGYRAQLKGKILNISAGYSHPVNLDIPEGLTVEVPKNTQVIVKGIDKQLVGEFAANIRSVRKPEPYKGKGIRYVDEHVRRKEGKKAGK